MVGGVYVGDDVWTDDHWMVVSGSVALLSRHQPLCYSSRPSGQFTVISVISLLTRPIKLYILVTPHIWLIWFSVTRHAELYGLLLPTFCLSLVTFHLVLEVFARQLLLSGIVSPLTSVPAKLSQHSVVI